MSESGQVNVAWGLTGYGPMWAPAYSSHMRAMGYASRYFTVNHVGKVGGAGCTDRMYTSSAENTLVRDMLENQEFTHLFMCEQDMILPAHTIPTLLELDKDIVSGVYFLRNGNGQACLYKKVLTPGDNKYPHSPVSIFPETAPFRVDCPGLGCVLIKRHVFETLKSPWFDLKEHGYGSDMYFYTHVREAGFEVWAHPGVLADQIDYKIWSIEDYHERLKTDPGFAASGFIINADRVLT